LVHKLGEGHKYNFNSRCKKRFCKYY